MENKKKLFDYLKSQKLMSLATFGTEISNCLVYYAVDDDFVFYFISEPESEHCKNIEANNKAACAIADSSQKVKDKKIGVQIKGEVSDVTGLAQFDSIIMLWNATNPGIESVISMENFRNKIINSKMYKIKPSEIKFFNEELYGEEGFEVFKFS